MNKKIFYSPLILLLFIPIYLLVDYFTLTKGYASVFEIFLTYLRFVFDYQVDIYNYVLENGTSGSGGIVSLLPLKPFEIGFNSLQNYRDYSHEFILKGVWFGFLGRHLIEFGPVGQYFATLISSSLFTLCTRLLTTYLCPREISFYLIPIFLFNAISTCWISEPWTSIFVYIFSIFSSFLISSLFYLYHQFDLEPKSL